VIGEVREEGGGVDGAGGGGHQDGGEDPRDVLVDGLEVAPPAGLSVSGAVFLHLFGKLADFPEVECGDCGFSPNLLLPRNENHRRQ